jgi:hypothetical protein
MDVAEILSLRLANQLLDGSVVKEPRDLVSWMGAMQSQHYEMARWGVGIRIPGTTDKEVEEALEKGDIARLHILRPTWHFVSRDDIYWMLYLSSPRLKIVMRSLDKGLDITASVMVKVRSVLEKELQGKSLTRQELNFIINEAGIIADNRRVNHFMIHAELNGIICNGTPRGKKQTYALLEEKIPKIADKFDKDECLCKLAYKYFRSHGPATLRDFIWWSGLTTAEAGQAALLIGNDFIQETIDGQTYIFHRDSKPTGNKRLLNLLPAFDEFIISYKDRKEFLHADHHKKIIVSPGTFQPAISMNGKIIGSWKRSSDKKNIIEPDYFHSINKSTENQVSKAAESYRKFIL